MNGMSFPRLALLLLVMAGVTYLMRVLPFTLLRRPVRSPFLRSLLAYIPYGVLSAMAFPSILYSTGSFPSAVAGTVAALVLAFFRRSLLVVALGACLAAMAVAVLMAVVWGVPALVAGLPCRCGACGGGLPLPCRIGGR